MNRRAFVKGSTTDFSSQSQRQRGDTLISSGPSRWRSAWCAERVVSTRSKVDDTQSRNGSVITGSSLCSCKFLYPPGAHLVVAHSRLYSALHLPSVQPYAVPLFMPRASRFIYLLIFFRRRNFTLPHRYFTCLPTLCILYVDYFASARKNVLHYPASMIDESSCNYSSISLRKTSTHNFIRHFLNSFNIDSNDFERFVI